jgi:hypothetical protein
MTSEPTPSPDASAAAEPESDQPIDTKAQFRAALERKRSRQASGGSGVFGDAKVPGAHGAAGAKRVFRRKSG